MGDRAQPVQAGNAIDQIRHRRAETRLDFFQALLVKSRQGKEQRRQTGIGIHFQANQNQRHPQRMPPHPFAAAQQALAINRLGKFSRLPDIFRFGSRQPGTQRLQGVLEIVLRSNGMDNRNHPAIITGRGGGKGGEKRSAPPPSPSS